MIPVFNSGTHWIRDSNCLRDSGFLELYFVFQSPGFRIPQARFSQIFRIPQVKGFRIPESLIRDFGTIMNACNYNSRLKIWFSFSVNFKNIPSHSLSKIYHYICDSWKGWDVSIYGLRKRGVRKREIEKDIGNCAIKFSAQGKIFKLYRLYCLSLTSLKCLWVLL